MKTKNWMLSVAMFAIAIVGAFAISSVQDEYHYRTDENDPETCTPITVNCQGNNVQCIVENPDGMGDRRVWSDTDCVVPRLHFNSTPVPPSGN